MSRNVPADAFPFPFPANHRVFVGKPIPPEEPARANISRNISADATPIPTSHQPASAEEPVPPKEPIRGKERREKKQIPSDTSSSDDSDDSSRAPRYKACNVVNVNKATNLHIGHRYQFSNTWQYNKQNNTSSENDYAAPSREERPSKELLNSRRELEYDDMYIVAENISIQWKKLARFLPPKPAFADGQLRTFENNHPNDLEETIIQMLQAWKQRHPSEANIGALATTLWNIGKGNIAKNLNP